MRYFITVLSFALLFGLAASTSAQVIAVDMNKAKLMWDWTQGAAPNDGTPDEFRVKCGGVSGTYTKITVVVGSAVRELPVKSAITGSGDWFCVVTAANQFGESGPTNEVPFVAGVGPSSPTNLVIQAQ